MLSREAKRRVEQWFNSLPSEKKLYINGLIDEKLENASSAVMDRIYVCISAALVEYDDGDLDFTLDDINCFIAAVGDYLIDAGERIEGEKMNKEVSFNEEEFKKICYEMFDAGYNQKRAIDVLRKKFPEAPKAVIPVYFKKHKEEWLKPRVKVKPYVNENSKPKIIDVDPAELKGSVDIKEDKVSKSIEREHGLDMTPEVEEVQEEIIQYIYPITAKFKGEQVEINKDHFVCSEGTFDNLEGLINYKEASIKEFRERIAAIEAIVKKFEND